MSRTGVRWLFDEWFLRIGPHSSKPHISGALGMNPGAFFSELKRRNVYKVAVTYAVFGWLLIQIATQTFPFLEIPNWAIRLVIMLVVIGFPISLLLAWAFELTPQGIKRTDDATRPHSRGGFLPVFWSIPTAILSESAAAAALGLVNSIGQAGGLAGPYVIGLLNERTHSLTASFGFIALVYVAAASVILSLRVCDPLQARHTATNQAETTWSVNNPE